MNRYLEKIWNISSKNQQAIDYVFLCQSSLDRNIDGYVEKHHMFPKCLCETNEEKLDKENLVVLSAKEHFIAHKLLSEMFEGNLKRKMLYALSALSFRKDGVRILDEDDYAVTKEASRLAKKGIPLSEEHKQKIKNKFAEYNPNKGRIISAETKKKQSLAKIGKPHYHSDETRKKLSAARIGLIIENKICPHCGKSGKPGAMGKWHFDNCRKREV